MKNIIAPAFGPVIVLLVIAGPCCSCWTIGNLKFNVTPDIHEYVSLTHAGFCGRGSDRR
jgi:hypothetical protein